jgi:hypothetical protein
MLAVAGGTIKTASAGKRASLRRCSVIRRPTIKVPNIIQKSTPTANAPWAKERQPLACNEMQAMKGPATTGNENPGWIAPRSRGVVIQCARSAAAAMAHTATTPISRT